LVLSPERFPNLTLSTGYSVSFAPERAQGLEHASPSALAEIEITPPGYGLHFPKLDADLWVPALLEGAFGSRAFMAAQLGARGGKATSEAKTKAARANGKRGGRPVKRGAAGATKKELKAKKLKPAKRKAARAKAAAKRKPARRRA
jgi:hypothetical protein